MSVLPGHIVCAGSYPAFFRGDATRDRPLIRHVLRMSGKADPRVCFLGTAQGDRPEAIARWYRDMHGLPARCSHLALFEINQRSPPLQDRLLQADIVFVGNGNTLNMLAVWRAQGIDRWLAQAWRQGAWLVGGSAGMGAWFEHAVTDSRPGGLSVIAGLGLLPGLACPHFDADPQRRAVLYAALREGVADRAYACDEDAALHFQGSALLGCLAASAPARGWRLQRDLQGAIVERALAVDAWPA